MTRMVPPSRKHGQINHLAQVLNRWIRPGEATMPAMFVVGGAVRDHLLNRPVNDVDIICQSPHNAAELIAASHMPHATVISFEKKPHPPCFRVVNKENSGDFIDVVNMRGDTIVDDLTQRDFTINAIAAEIKPDGGLDRLVDPLKGRQDLERQLIRCCRPDTFAADPLRMLRAFRLSAILNFIIDPDTLMLIKTNAKGIATVAFERITAELFTLFACPDSFPHIQKLDRMGLLTAIFPEIVPMKGCGQNAYHHLDVWEHSLATLANYEAIIKALCHYFPGTNETISTLLARGNTTAVLKLAALLHDVGKPASRRFNAEKQKSG